MLGGIVGAIAGAIGSAVSASSGGGNKNNSSSSSGSSWSGSSSSKPSSSWSGSSSSVSSANTDYASQFLNQMGSGSASQLQGILNQRLDKLGGTADAWQQEAQSYVDSLYAQKYQPTGGLFDKYDWAQQFEDNIGTGGTGYLQNVLDSRYDKLNGSSDAWQEQAQSYLDGLKQQYYGQQQQMAQQYKEQLDALMQQYQAQQDAIKAQQQAAIDKSVANLNAQKDSVTNAGLQANQAAQQNYMNLLNPNGANAEQLAALGLTNSGLSESAAISAQNAYNSAVNSNAQNVQNQLQAIELAIENAKLGGDLATAEQLQSYYNTVLQAGMQNANNILASNQWALTNGQSWEQQMINNMFTQAGLTGSLNGNPTMQGQQLSYTIEGMSLDNQLKQLQLLLQQAYGMQQAEAELEAQKLANTGASLSNTYQELYNQYMKNQYGL